MWSRRVGRTTLGGRRRPRRTRAIARATVIDDDADIADLLCELLESLGHECMKFASALPGLDELIASRPDLIVIDIGLHPQREEQTGLQVVHAARSGTPLRDVPIVVLATDRGRLTDAMPGLMERGDVHRLDKPFDLRTFDHVVAAALGTEREGAPSEAFRRPQAVGDTTAHQLED